MNNLQQDFLRQSVLELESLGEKFEADDYSENLLREAFRRVHTIKGTAQTFGFGEASRLAHELENLLQAARENKTIGDGNFVSLAREGIGFLVESLRAPDDAAEDGGEYRQEFVEKIRRAAKSDLKIKKSSLRLPPEILQQLSQREKDTLDAAIENELNLFLIEAAFDFANFETDFKKLKSDLDSSGEVIATFPSSKFASRLGFQFFLTTEKNIDEISQITSPFGAEIIYQIESGQPANQSDFDEMLQQVVDGAKELAKRLGKKLSIDASLQISSKNFDQHLKIIFDILLHLTRNAIDHAVEKKGKIKILLSEEENGLRLIVSDDGKGVDLEKVRAKALEKNLISAEKILTEAQIIDLIFLPEFTTASEVTEISGRGVGLDAVKIAAENAGGKFSVKSVRNSGTTFEVFLPDEK